MREIKFYPSLETTHVRVHAGSRARRTYPGIALIDTGSPQLFVSCSFFKNMVSAGAGSLSGVQRVTERNCSGLDCTLLSTGKMFSVLLGFRSLPYNKRSTPISFQMAPWSIVLLQPRIVGLVFQHGSMST